MLCFDICGVTSNISAYILADAIVSNFDGVGIRGIAGIEDDLLSGDCDLEDDVVGICSSDEIGERRGDEIGERRGDDVVGICSSDE